jgi:hypothetical protein
MCHNQKPAKPPPSQTFSFAKVGKITHFVPSIHTPDSLYFGLSFGFRQSFIVLYAAMFSNLDVRGVWLANCLKAKGKNACGD